MTQALPRLLSTLLMSLLNSVSLALRLSIIALTCSPFFARAEDVAVTFDGANKLYEQGKFVEAAAGYEKLVLGGQSSAPIYYNLGNAYFKSGQIGRAIRAYRQAERLTPRDPDLRANLQFAR